MTRERPRPEPMRLSDLIAQLEAELRTRGDLIVCTPDGRVSAVRMYPCADGVSDPRRKPNEVVLETIAD